MQDHDKKSTLKGLGKGLDALFGDNSSQTTSALQKIAITKLIPNANQPRKHFNAETLKGLSESIKQDGIIQPILVRKLNQDNGAEKAETYEIIAGERRWRAAQKAGLHEVPIQIRDLNNKQVMKIAMVENLQREDLNAIEQAEGYKVLLEDHNFTQEELADSLGISRSNIANTLRLLNLSQKIKSLVAEGKLSAGHARSLIGLETQRAEELALESIKNSWDVRYMEKLRNQNKKTAAAPVTPAANLNSDIDNLQKAMSQQLGMQVTIKQKKGSNSSGNITINYSSIDQFDELMSRLLRSDS